MFKTKRNILRTKISQRLADCQDQTCETKSKTKTNISEPRPEVQDRDQDQNIRSRDHIPALKGHLRSLAMTPIETAYTTSGLF